MKKFVFNNVEYSSESSLRKAIWESERKVFATPKNDTDWQKLGVTIVQVEKQGTSESEKALLRLLNAKRERKVAVARIVVEVDGMAFDGDETSQTRMARSIVAMTDEDRMPWVLSDNSIAEVTKHQLQAALRLAGLKQAELWTVPYSGDAL